MLKLVKITHNYKNLHEVKRLYKSAFPKNERDPFSHLLSKKDEGIEFVAFEDESVFCGFAFLMTYKKVSHLLYFAIDERFREHGYGAKSLQLLHEYKGDCTIIVDVEVDDEGCDNLSERVKRINFYLHNGYKKTDISYFWHKVHYELLSFGDIDVEQFDEFWEHFKYQEDMGKFLYESFRSKLD